MNHKNEFVFLVYFLTLTLLYLVFFQLTLKTRMISFAIFNDTK